MSLSDIEVRVLGSLLEKERTTPESYPLSSNALLLACNQKSNRDPVTDYGILEVEDTMRSLESKGLAHSSRGDSARVVKHQHKLHNAFQLSGKEFALLAVLMLRGLQTPGELRTRTERYTHFPDLTAVEESLQHLLEHQPPLVKNYGRGPGQSQDRWGHTLGPDPEKQKPRVRYSDSSPPARTREESDEGELEALRQEVASLRAQVERLLEHAGLDWQED